MKRYIAGYLDGEGCIRWQTNRAYVSITNTYPRVLRMIVSRFGGAVRQSPGSKAHHRTVYRWEIRGKPAIRFLRKIRPFLIEKKRQATIVLELDNIGVEYDSSYVRRLVRELAMLKRIDYATKED